jgi:hypothetical protein
MKVDCGRKADRKIIAQQFGQFEEFSRWDKTKKGRRFRQPAAMRG